VPTPLAEVPIFRHAWPINKTLWEDATMQDDARARRSQAQFSRRCFMASAAVTLAAGAAGRVPAFAQAGPSRTLIKGGVVLSFDRGVGDFDKADVLIEGSRIAAVRPDISAQATVIDATDMIVLPGFIDTHHHCYQSALRNVLGNGLLSDYFRDISGAATNHYRPEDAYIGNLIGALRALDAGITTITDLSQVSNTPEHSDALIKGLKDSGIRAVYAYSRGSGAAAKYPGDVERIQKQHFASSDQLVTLALGTAVNKEQWLLARRHGLRIFTHVVGGNPGVGPDEVMKLGDEGLMGRTTSISISPMRAMRRCAASRTPAARSPSRARSRWPCVMACRRFSRRSMPASGRASQVTSRRPWRPTCSRRCARCLRCSGRSSTSARSKARRTCRRCCSRAT
jgi:hypothetical protein